MIVRAGELLKKLEVIESNRTRVRKIEEERIKIQKKFRIMPIKSMINTPTPDLMQIAKIVGLRCRYSNLI
jgi:hypothetical protein